MTSVPELSLGAQVLATDGELGTLRALIVDAATGSISHLAVTNGEVPNSARLIAMRHVSQADAHQAQLDMSRREALRCPRLVVPGTVPDSADQGHDETSRRGSSTSLRASTPSHSVVVCPLPRACS